MFYDTMEPKSVLYRWIWFNFNLDAGCYQRIYLAHEIVSDTLIHFYWGQLSQLPQVILCPNSAHIDSYFNPTGIFNSLPKRSRT